MMNAVIARWVCVWWVLGIAPGLPGPLLANPVAPQPDNGPSPQASAAVLRHDGMTLIRQGNPAAAVPKLRAAADLEPTRWESLDALLDVYIQTGEHGGRKPLAHEKKEHLRKRLGDLFLPTRARAVELSDMGTTYRMIDMPTAAERCYQEALAMQEKRRYVRGQAVALGDLGEVYKAAGDPAKAEPFSRRAAELMERARGPNDPETATSINNLAKVVEACGRYHEAEPLYQRALAIREKALRAEQVDIASSLNDIAVLYTTMGQYAKAVPMIERALAINRKTLGSEHPTTLTNLNNLAAAYERMDDFKKAGPLLEQALAIREKVLGPSHRDTAASLNNLAILFKAEGFYTKSESLEKQALAIYEKTLGPEHPETASNLNSLASLYQEMGRYADAEALIKRALAITEKTLGPQHPDTAFSLDNLADLYLAMGDYASAEPLYSRALTIYKNALGPDHPLTALGCNNLASLYEQVGDYAKAEPLYETGLAITEKTVGPEHPDTANGYRNLASLHAIRGDTAKAEPLFVRALAIDEKVLGPDHPSTAIDLNNLARLYSDMGNDGKAEPLFTRALAINEKKFGHNHPSTATNLNNLAGVCSRAGNYARAETLYRQALAINEKALGSDNPATALNVNNLAFVQLDRNNPVEGLELASRGEEAGERTLANVLSFSSEQQRSEFEKTHAPYDSPATLGNAPLIARTLLHWKGVVLDSVIEDRVVARIADARGMRQQLAAMQGLKSQLFKLALGGPKNVPETEPGIRTQQREKLAGQIEEMEAVLARKVGALGRSRRALEVTPEQVQSALGPREALVEFIRYHSYLGKGRWEARYGALVFAPRDPLQWVSLGAAADIEKTVRLYQKSARGKTDDVTLQDTLHGLGRELWAPVEKVLPEDTESVIFSPDGELNFVSFATLLGADERFLAEKYKVRYVSSGRDLLRTASKPPSPADHRIELYGNPDFQLNRNKLAARFIPTPGAPATTRAIEIQDFRGMQLPPLEGTAVECAALAKVARERGATVRVRTGAEATEASLQEIDSPRVLHLATHGFFLPEIELGDPYRGTRQKDEIPRGKIVDAMHRSGLALAGAQTTLEAWGRGELPDPANDGILTADEVGTLNLAGTWLVTLSACETGSGEARAGEGVLGLRRGFVQAGAQNLLMTLWPVSDDTTEQIILDFYAEAFQSGDAPQAIADVQRNWLVKLREERGLQAAVTLAGPFIMSSQGSPGGTAER